jgi:hypothetical protein
MGASPGPWDWEGDTNWLLLDACGREIIRIDGDSSVGPGPKDATLIRLAPDMASMLRELEWEGDGGEGAPPHETCPICYAVKQAGHTPDCRLSALLMELPK